MEYAYYAIIALACITAAGDWRRALYLCLAIDVFRDPVRKLMPDQPVWVTVLGAIPWGVCFLRAFSAEQPELLAAVPRYPKLSTALTCMTIALIPGFMISCIQHDGGYRLAIIGTLSYLGPFLGVGLGYLFVRDERGLKSLLAAYVLINAVGLIGTPLEFFEVDVPGLGGIRMDWIRYRDGYIVDLISGYYRSPDVMGLHAAHVMIFAAMLALRSRGLMRMFWLMMIGWGGTGVLLCGRRKMMVIPLVFAVAYAILNYRLGSSRKITMGVVLISTLTALMVGGLAATRPEWFEYTKYASTVLSEAPDRLTTNVLGGMFSTVRQVGMLGAGLGCATQGRYYVATTSGSNVRGWQEDGLSRLVLELGVPGFLLMLLTAYLMLGVFASAIRLTPRATSVRDWQLMFAAAVLGDAASFIVAHQHYSGDPIAALLVTFFAGMILGAPRMVSQPPAVSPEPPPRRPSTTN
jgi:hypothetical protein